MNNFNLKTYVYEKRAEGLSESRIAETLGVTVDELAFLMEPKMEYKPDILETKTEKPEFVENDFNWMEE